MNKTTSELGELLQLEFGTAVHDSGIVGLTLDATEVDAEGVVTAKLLLDGGLVGMCAATNEFLAMTIDTRGEWNGGGRARRQFATWIFDAGTDPAGMDAAGILFRNLLDA